MYKMYSLNGFLGIQFLALYVSAHVHRYNLVALVDHLISCMPFSTLLRPETLQAVIYPVLWFTLHIYMDITMDTSCTYTIIKLLNSISMYDCWWPTVLVSLLFSCRDELLDRGLVVSSSSLSFYNFLHLFHQSIVCSHPYNYYSHQQL